MDFEFDPQKSKRNLEKHHIDFIEGQRLWSDLHRIEIPVRTEDESRFFTVGMIDGKHWTAVITYRNDNVRIISVRRSRIEEVTLYEG